MNSHPARVSLIHPSLCIPLYPSCTSIKPPSWSASGGNWRRQWRYDASAYFVPMRDIYQFRNTEYFLLIYRLVGLIHHNRYLHSFALGKRNCSRVELYQSYRVRVNHTRPVQYTASLGDEQTKFSGASGDREIFIFPVQLTTSRIGNLNWFIHTLLFPEQL